MPAALVNVLAAAAESCPELEAWRRCEVSRDARCAACTLSGPEICEAQVIKALARRLFDLNATIATDPKPHVQAS